MRKKINYVLLLSCIAALIFAVPAFAGGLENSNLVTGTKNLLTDATAILTGLVAGVTIVLSIKNALRWQLASDEEKPKHKKNFTSTLVIGVIGTCISGLITVILSYYGG